MITLYGLNHSRSLRVLWALEEAALPYRYHHLDFRAGEQLDTQYQQLNPAAKVPALKDGDLTLTESAAIVNYLASKSDQLLIPRNLTMRAEYDRWSYFILTELEQGLWTMGKHKFALPEKRRVPAVRETAQWEFQRALALLSTGLGKQDYLLGDKFSAVDILAGHTLLWAMAFHCPIEQENLQDYLQRLQQRPALQRALQREAETEPGASSYSAS